MNIKQINVLVCKLQPLSNLIPKKTNVKSLAVIEKLINISVARSAKIKGRVLVTPSFLLKMTILGGKL